MRILVVYHDDADGMCAAAIARRACPDDDMVFYGMQYGDALPPLPGPGEDTVYDKIFILDFSLHEDDMRRLVDELCYPVIWIDHHVTAIEQLLDFDYLNGLRRDGTAACMLTWEWFFPNEEPPWAVKYIADRDVWKFSYGDDTRNFYEMWSMVRPDPGDVAGWNELFALTGIPLYQFIQKGELLRSARTTRLLALVHSYAHETTIDGHAALKINASPSGDLGQVIKDLGFAVAWCYVEKRQNGELVRVNTLYSEEVDVSMIAVARGGGGHRGAAGFVEVLGRWKIEKRGGLK